MEYLLKSAALLSIFYFFYKLFLENDTFFHTIRIFLLTGAVLSFAIPLITITKYVNEQPFIIENATVIQNAIDSGVSKSINWVNIVSILYIIGVLFFFLRFTFQLFSLSKIISSEKVLKKGKYKYIFTDKNISPFSFFNYIIINPKQFDKLEFKQILEHEKVHVNQWHSVDILLFNLLQITLWFNPFSWLIQKEVQKNLEYLADGVSIHYAPEKKAYQYLLLKSNTSTNQFILSSNFYNSLIKKRIDMLHKNRSQSFSQIKFALIIPFLVVFVFIFNTKTVAQKKQEYSIELQTDYGVEMISKDFQKSDLEQLKNTLSKDGIEFKYKKLKYNTSNEITSINIELKNKIGAKANLSQSSDKPINPIQIKYSNTNGELSIGNISENIFIGDDMHKNVFIEEFDDDNVIFISGDSTKVIKHKSGEDLVWVSKNDKGTTEKHVIQIESDGNADNNTWTIKEGDTDNHKIIIKKKGGDTGDVIIMKDVNTNADADIIKSKNKNIVYINKDDKNPLVIVDGQERSKAEMEKLSPDSIESINVLKGQSAEDKYGEKGKNGVIEIKTKK